MLFLTEKVKNTSTYNKWQFLIVAKFTSNENVIHGLTVRLDKSPKFNDEVLAKVLGVCMKKTTLFPL